MPLSWNEIRDRATAFAHEWAEESYERGEAQTFWNEFFKVFGLNRRRVASFEAHVKKVAEKSGYIDCFWPGTLIAEHKSRGKDLDSAFVQAIDYFANLKERDLPQYVVVSDFATIRLYDLEESTQTEFPLKDFPKVIKKFGFIAGYKPQLLRTEDPVNAKAAGRMGRLHDALQDSGYGGHKLEMLLVRLLFCLFADDTGIFQPVQAFRLWVEERTAEDGTDLGSKLTHAFQILNTPVSERSKSLDEQLAEFPYINGNLFAETLPIADFDSNMREALLEACALDWSQISPAVFGAMFQSIMDAKARRNLGAHYTSEKNIEKLIKPLFLDELRAEFEKVKKNRSKLSEFHKKLRTLTFLDPACGCGNFLVVTYRALRELELDILRASRKSLQLALDVHDMVRIDVDQFFGIELEEFPARIAEVALWLTDHQMNMKVSEEFGMYFARIPLHSTPYIHHGNALRVNWDEVIPKERLSFILGNPPFGGHHYQDDEQKFDQRNVLSEIKACGVLDFVSNWFFKAANVLQRAPHIKAAFVATNSITQGEQVGLLWPSLLARGIHLLFAHRTFKWSNEARGMAAVHCVIIGIGINKPHKPIIYDYTEVDGNPHAISVSHINPYLVDGPDVIIKNRREPICDVPRMSWGNKPTDGGHLILSPEEKHELLAAEPQAAKFIKRYMSGGDLINGKERYCLWLVDVSPRELRSMPLILRRVSAVRQKRLESRAKTTRDYAEYPTLFRQIAQPDTDYLAIPEVSSEKRIYIPIAFLSKNIICSNKIQFVPDATLFHFGILQSAMHMAWVSAVAGRLESRYSYSNSIVYNNFPWPQNVSKAKLDAIGSAAQNLLNSRKQFPEATLADLYEPLSMPSKLLKAHRNLDKVVDAAYSRKRFAGETDRITFLFEQFRKITSKV